MDTRARLVEDVAKAAGKCIDTLIADYKTTDAYRRAVRLYVEDEHAQLCVGLWESVSALRAHDAAAKPLKWGCRVVGSKRESTYFNVVTACGKYALCGGVTIAASWNEIKDNRGADYWGGIYNTEKSALSALASAPPPPGVEPKVETVAANANYSLAVPSPEYRTVTSPAEIRAVLDRLPEHAPVTIQTSREGESVRSDHPGTVYRSDSLTNCVYVYGMGLSRSDITRLTYRLSDDPATKPAAETVIDLEPADRSPNAQEQLDTLASRVAEVERSCSQCHSHIDEIERANEVHSDNNGILFRDALDRDEKMQDDIAALRRDVEAMKSDLYKYAADTVRNSAQIKNMAGVMFPPESTPTPPATASDKPRYEIVTNYAQAHWAIRRLADGEYWMNGVPSWTSFSSTATWFNSRPIAAAVARVLEEQP